MPALEWYRVTIAPPPSDPGDDGVRYLHVRITTIGVNLAPILFAGDDPVEFHCLQGAFISAEVVIYRPGPAGPVVGPTLHFVASAGAPIRSAAYAPRVIALVLEPFFPDGDESSSLAP